MVEITDELKEKALKLQLLEFVSPAFVRVLLDAPIDKRIRTELAYLKKGLLGVGAGVEELTVGEFIGMFDTSDLLSSDYLGKKRVALFSRLLQKVGLELKDEKRLSPEAQAILAILKSR